jgi:hypothetical protein
MLLLILPQGPAIAGVDVDQIIGDLMPALGAGSLADLSFASEAELYQWADEAVKRLSHRCGVFVFRDTSTSIESEQSAYPVPQGHIDTIHASLVPVTGAPLSLRATTSAELGALDGTWKQSLGPVTRFSMDADGTEFLTLYMAPAATGGTLAWIFHRFPAEIQSGATAVDVASPIGDYLTYAMLGEARRKQSEMAMPEVADWCDARLALMEQVITAYWGPGE